jgi:hypothetical protein
MVVPTLMATRISDKELSIVHQTPAPSTDGLCDDAADSVRRARTSSSAESDHSRATAGVGQRTRLWLELPGYPRFRGHAEHGRRERFGH